MMNTIERNRKKREREKRKNKKIRANAIFSSNNNKL